MHNFRQNVKGSNQESIEMKKKSVDFYRKSFITFKKNCLNFVLHKPGIIYQVDYIQKKNESHFIITLKFFLFIFLKLISLIEFHYLFNEFYFLS